MVLMTILVPTILSAAFMKISYLDVEGAEDFACNACFNKAKSLGEWGQRKLYKLSLVGDRSGGPEDADGEKSTRKNINPLMFLIGSKTFWLCLAAIIGVVLCWTVGAHKDEFSLDGVSGFMKVGVLGGASILVIASFVTAVCRYQEINKSDHNLAHYRNPETKDQLKPSKVTTIGTFVCFLTLLLFTVAMLTLGFTEIIPNDGHMMYAQHGSMAVATVVMLCTISVFGFWKSGKAMFNFKDAVREYEQTQENQDQADKLGDKNAPSTINGVPTIKSRDSADGTSKESQPTVQPSEELNYAPRGTIYRRQNCSYKGVPSNSSQDTPPVTSANTPIFTKSKVRCTNGCNYQANGECTECGHKQRRRLCEDGVQRRLSRAMRL